MLPPMPQAEIHATGDADRAQYCSEESCLAGTATNDKVTSLADLPGFSGVGRGCTSIGIFKLQIGLVHISHCSGSTLCCLEREKRLPVRCQDEAYAERFGVVRCKGKVS